MVHVSINWIADREKYRGAGDEVPPQPLSEGVEVALAVEHFVQRI